MDDIKKMMDEAKARYEKEKVTPFTITIDDGLGKVVSYKTNCILAAINDNDGMRGICLTMCNAIELGAAIKTLCRIIKEQLAEHPQLKFLFMMDKAGALMGDEDDDN